MKEDSRGLRWGFFVDFFLQDLEIDEINDSISHQFFLQKWVFFF